MRNFFNKKITVGVLAAALTLTVAGAANAATDGAIVEAVKNYFTVTIVKDEESGNSFVFTKQDGEMEDGEVKIETNDGSSIGYEVKTDENGEVFVVDSETGEVLSESEVVKFGVTTDEQGNTIMTDPETGEEITPDEVMGKYMESKE